MNKILKEIEKRDLDYELTISNKILKLRSESINFMCSNNKKGKEWILNKLKDI